jgi:hypothetical protein
MASGHVNRVNRPNTRPQPTSRTVKKTLANREPSTHANREPSTHGTSRKWRPSRLAAAYGSRADSDKVVPFATPHRASCAKHPKIQPEALPKATVACKIPATCGMRCELIRWRSRDSRRYDDLTRLRPCH